MPDARSALKHFHRRFARSLVRSLSLREKNPRIGFLCVGFNFAPGKTQRADWAGDASFFSRPAVLLLTDFAPAWARGGCTCAALPANGDAATLRRCGHPLRSWFSPRPWR